MICHADGRHVHCRSVRWDSLRSKSRHQEHLFLESAYFSPEYIRRTAQHHSLKTDASFRYERGTDPNMTVFALKRAALLIKALAGGQVSSEVIDVYPQPVEDFRVAVRYRNVDRLIGKVIDRAEIKKILDDLDIAVAEEDEHGLVVLVPPYRVDVQREADMIEEVLRIHGYDQVATKEHLRADYLASFPELDSDKLRTKISEMLVGEGFFEIITNSLTKPQYAQALGQKAASVPMLNPLSEELCVMRQSLLFSGLEVIAHNVNRQQKNLKLFEFGTTYQKQGDKYLETNELAVFMTGQLMAESWMASDAAVSFHHLSSTIRKFFNRFDVTASSQKPTEESIFDYGLAWAHQGKILASIGRVTSQIAGLVGVRQPVFYANVRWPSLVSILQARNTKERLVYQEISKFPEVRRDVSLVLDQQVSFSEVAAIAKKASNQLVRDINVFDIYEGESVGKNKKAYALSFTLQDQHKTLTDKLIDKTMKKLMHTLEHDLNATIRK